MTLDKYERTYCDCAKCVAACSTLPGSLAPGDVHLIAEHLGFENDPDFIKSAFRASEGALVARKGVPFRIPTIVPAQLDNGDCVFLKNGRCTVHAVAPFGCSRFNVCDGPDKATAYNRVSAAMLTSIIHSQDYMLCWAWLFRKGSRARPLTERRRLLQEAIDNMEDDSR